MESFSLKAILKNEYFAEHTLGKADSLEIYSTPATGANSLQIQNCSHASYLLSQCSVAESDRLLAGFSLFYAGVVAVLCSPEGASPEIQMITMMELGVTCSELMKGLIRQWITNLLKPS